MKNPLFRSFLLMLMASAATAADSRYSPVAANVDFNAVIELPFRDSDHTLSYGANQYQFGKLWLPDSVAPAKALLIMIHGGCWLNQFDMEHTYPFATALADAGYVVWSLEYRRTGDPGGGWPGTFEDIQAGINFAGSLSTYEIDVENLAILGHSAGGHLALLAGSDRGSLTVAPKLVVGLAAITDVVAYAAGDNSCQTATPAFLGGTFADKPDVYRSANPASQILHSNTYLLQGTMDQIVPLSQSELPGAKTLLSQEASHFDWVHPGSPAFGRLLQLLEESF